MEDIVKLFGNFLVFILGVYVLSEVVKALSVEISGLNFGPLLLGAFIIAGIVWFIKEVMGR